MSVVKTVVVIRHSKAGKPAEGEGDKERRLSQEGFGLARRRGESLEKMGLIPFDLAITSNRIRTQETALAAAGEEVPCMAYADLFEQQSEGEEKLMWGWYTKHGEKPLRHYLEHGTPEEVEVLRRFARRASERILRIVSEQPCERVLVVNHAMYAPAIVSAICSTDHEYLLDRWWGECEGVVLRLEDGKVTEVTSLPSLE